MKCQEKKKFPDNLLKTIKFKNQELELAEPLRNTHNYQN